MSNQQQETEDFGYYDQDSQAEANMDSVLWPQKGDKLFAPDIDLQLNASMNVSLPWDPCSVWYPYVEGYMRAADLLVKTLTEDPIRCRTVGVNYLVYPIGFLYRHHLELRLKYIILESAELYDGVIVEEKKLLRSHDLSWLWEQYKRVIEVCLAGSDSEFQAVEKCIKEFCDIDKGYGFRYPVDKHNNPSLPNVPLLVNIRHLANTVAKIANYLDCAQTALQEGAKDMISQ